MDNIYKNIVFKVIIQKKKQKILMVFDDMIADMISNKKLNPKVTELFKKKVKYFFCFYSAILFRCTKKY